MSASDTVQTVPGPWLQWRRSKLLILAAILAFVIGATVGGYIYVTTAAQKRLEAAITLADRLDPGWRLEDIDAKRPSVPDEENSARRIISACRLVGPWNTPNKGAMYALQDLAPEVQINEPQQALLRAELTQVDNALLEARKVANLPCGRYPIIWSPDALSTNLPDIQDSRTIGTLLMMDVIHAAQEKDSTMALVSWRALFNTSRAVGDEPMIVPQLIRIAIRGVALEQLDRVLAQLQISESELADIQRMLVEDDKQPCLLIAARGDRASLHRFMEALKRGDAKTSTIMGPGFAGARGISSYLGFRSKGLDEWGYSALVGPKDSAHAGMLEILTEFVEIAKLPFEKQGSRLQVLLSKMKAQPYLARLVCEPMDRVYKAFQRSQAGLRCAIVGLAVERYRLKHQRWPDSPSSLVPDYLEEVPTDPHDGNHLRYRRLADGVVIYSVGPDQQDNGGNLTRNPTAPGTDIGFRLWNVDKRRQPPPKTPEGP
jgi:hypothetical protein